VSDPRIDFERFTLPNGLTVIVHHDPTLPMVAVNLCYHVGSANERPGRTGFAHLFEHIMFEGSAHVPPGEMDALLAAVGAGANGGTSTDRTVYVTEVPSNALELPLWLEADRMGWLLDTMDQGKLDLQRDVVMNERREVYENQPYGLEWETVSAALYPPDHPYHWPVIGSMDDLEAASLADVEGFFRSAYGPANASLVLAGDVEPARARDLVERWFGEIPAGVRPPRPTPADPVLPADVGQVLEDEVQLPRLHLAWHSGGALGAEDAALDLAARILAGGRSSRLHRRLVFDAELAADVSGFQDGGRLGGAFHLVATGRPGVGLAAIDRVVRDELEALAHRGPSEAELLSARTRWEAEMVRSLQRLGGFDGRADRLNGYLFLADDPGFLAADLDRIRAVTPEAIAHAIRMRLVESPGVSVSIVPKGRTALAAGGGR
jgi:zinc protease